MSKVGREVEDGGGWRGRGRRIEGVVFDPTSVLEVDVDGRRNQKYSPSW